MKEKYLVVNAGSSSMKYRMYEMPGEIEIVSGGVERIGQEKSIISIKIGNEKWKDESNFIRNQVEAVEQIIHLLKQHNIIEDISEIKGIGHRVLHGGEIYKESTVIDEKVIKDIEDLIPLGPVHHPGALAGINAFESYIPGVFQVAVFDTSFHQTIPQENYMYPVPYEWYREYGVRKYGFHGTSHKYIRDEMRKKLGKQDINIISCHIGSGASIAAIKNGICDDTTMGLTPLDGVMMGTRSGSIDPSIIGYIAEKTNLSTSIITHILNNKSGLLGISQCSNDYRDIEEAIKSGNPQAKLASDMLEKSILRYIAQYYFELDGKVDAICFTAGLGENAINLRKNLVEKLANTLDIKLDDQANQQIAGYKSVHEGIITTPDSKIPVYVIPTNEEVMILRDTYTLAQAQKETEKQHVKVKK